MELLKINAFIDPLLNYINMNTNIKIYFAYKAHILNGKLFMCSTENYLAKNKNKLLKYRFTYTSVIYSRNLGTFVKFN